jgi:hypothetical protein
MRILSEKEFQYQFGHYSIKSINGVPAHISEGAIFVVCGIKYTPVDDYHQFNIYHDHHIVVRKDNLYYVGDFNYAKLEPTKKYLQMIYRGVDFIQAMEFMEL